MSVHHQSTLKIHVIRAEFPKTSFQEPVETFIKINFTQSNIEKHMSPLSKRISNTDFTFRYDGYCLFNKLSMNQRIIISACVMDGLHSIVLGSMSFGIRKIWESKIITGWYYLLKDNIGIKKHLKVYQDAIPRSVTVDVLNNHTENTSSAIIIVNLRRKSNEFGFTICGNQPPYIGKVESNSAAEDCKLKSGDIIVKIEQLLVFSCSAKAIAQILRLYQDDVTLTIYRTSNLQKQENYQKENSSKSQKDILKFGSKAKPISWLKKITTKKKIHKSNENFQQDSYISNLRYKLQDCQLNDNLIPLDSDIDNENPPNVIERLQYLGHIPSIRFSTQNQNVEFCSALWLIESNNRISVTVLLFPHLILVTHVEPDGFYTVIRRPIMLDSILYLSMPITSKYDLLIQYRFRSNSTETVHFYGDSVELLTNLLKEKRLHQKTEIITT